MSTVVGFAPRRPDGRRLPAVPSAVLGVLIFITSEAMFFLALISAYFVVKARTYATWAPPGTIKLPVATTALNTVILLASGALMILASRAYDKPATRERGGKLFGQAVLLGAMFVAFQGYEWVKLLRYGLTISSGLFGATFFLLIGAHGLHALAAVVFLAAQTRRVAQGRARPESVRAMMLFWSFVVSIWPLLYGFVYF